MTLAEFLLARIAEDEAVALAASDSPWRTEGSKYVSGAYIISRGGGSVSHATEVTTPDAEHIVRHDPARVLAECEAKRRIVELLDYERSPGHPCAHSVPCPSCGALAGHVCLAGGEVGHPSTYVHAAREGAAFQSMLIGSGGRRPIHSFQPADSVLRALTLPYADHPDYRDEWRP